MTDLQDKISGSILAMAIGDALGANVEGFTAKKIANMFGQLREFSQIGVFYTTLPERSDISKEKIYKLMKYKRSPSVYTDDTQQAILLVESLVEAGQANRKDYANRIVEIVKKTRSRSKPLGIFRGYGPGFKKVVENLLSNIPLDECAIDSAGNGAAMRIAPVGLFYYDNPQQSANAAIEISLLTHRDIRALLAASAVATAVSLAVNNKVIKDKKLFLKTVLSILQKLSLSGELKEQSERRKQFFSAFDILINNIHNSYQVISQALSKYSSKILNQRISAEAPFALCSVLMSFWHFLYHCDSTEEAIVSAVNSGGDADTIAAITGAMIGALRGKSSIPIHWIKAIKNADQLELRAYALTKRTTKLKNWKNFIEMESNI